MCVHIYTSILHYPNSNQSKINVWMNLLQDSSYLSTKIQEPNITDSGNVVALAIQIQETKRFREQEIADNKMRYVHMC